MRTVSMGVSRNSLPLDDSMAETTLQRAEAAPQAYEKKRIVIYGMNYSPEMAWVGKYTGEIAEHLAENGLEVTVVTTPPHYPGWKVNGQYLNAYSRSIENNVKVLRAPLLLRRQMRGIWRLLAPLSFALTSSPLIVWQILRRKPDLVFCVEPTLFAAPLAQLAAWIVGAKTILHVQDLEVDAAFAVGHLGSNKWLKKLGFAFERYTLKRFDKLITISTRMSERLVGKGTPLSKISLVRNWVDLAHIYPLDAASQYRSEIGFEPTDFVVLYSGNIGAKQGLEVLLGAAELLRDNARIKFVIAGEGPSKEALQTRFAGLPGIIFMPFQPYDRFNEFLNMADLHALPQEAGAADLVLPSKLGGMLASGRPILVTAEPGTELALFLGDCAEFTRPGDVSQMAEKILELATDRKTPFDQSKQGALSRVLSRDDGFQRIAEVLELRGPGLAR